MKRSLAAMALGMTLGTAYAGPSISVGQMHDYLEGGKSTYLKRIYNSGDSTAFVRINILEMTYDAAGKSTETSLESATAQSAERTGLIASPARLIIPTSGTQATRLVYRGERDRERYYRVRFIPVIPQKEDQFDVSEGEREAYKAAMSAGINVMAGYGTIFTVRPASERYDTKIEDGPTAYQIANDGNTTVVLENFKDCPSDQAQACLPATMTRIRPGTRHSFAKAAGRVYDFTLIEGTEKKNVRVDK